MRKIKPQGIQMRSTCSILIIHLVKPKGFMVILIMVIIIVYCGRLTWP